MLETNFNAATEASSSTPSSKTNIPANTSDKLSWENTRLKVTANPSDALRPFTVTDKQTGYSKDLTRKEAIILYELSKAQKPISYSDFKTLLQNYGESTYINKQCYNLSPIILELKSTTEQRVGRHYKTYLQLSHLGIPENFMKASDFIPDTHGQPSQFSKTKKAPIIRPIPLQQRISPLHEPFDTNPDTKKPYISRGLKSQAINRPDLFEKATTKDGSPARLVYTGQQIKDTKPPKIPSKSTGHKTGAQAMILEL